MDMLIGGRWQGAASGRTEDVTSPFDGAGAGTVPVADAADVQAALDCAERGAITWRRTPAHERTRVLTRAAELADERAEQIAQIISAESGKAITEARGEASRSGDLIRLSACAVADGAIVSPAVVAGVDPDSPFSQDEPFGPAVAVSSADDWESAIAQANGTPYGLGAGVFTADVSGAPSGRCARSTRAPCTSTGRRCGGPT